MTQVTLSRDRVARRARLSNRRRSWILRASRDLRPLHQFDGTDSHARSCNTVPCGSQPKSVWP